jgi:hypothetical protein
MFSAPFIPRQPQSKIRSITLGWPQFVAVVVGVCTVVVVGAILSMHDIYEVVYRHMVLQYEHAFGFEVGLVRGVPAIRSWASGASLMSSRAASWIGPVCGLAITSLAHIRRSRSCTVRSAQPPKAGANVSP